MSLQVFAGELVLKIPVTHEGVYRIAYNDLGYYGQPYGIEPRDIDPRQIHLYNRDRDVAIYVYGEEDGKFGQGDYIEFYAIPVGPADPEYKYTGENVYWLKISSDPPVRMTSWESAGAAAPEPFFLHTLHAERNWVYWETMPDGEGLDHWFWGQKITAGSKQDYTFSLSNIASTTGTATVRVYLHGRTDDPADPDHRTRISLNGKLLGEVVWDGQTPVIHAFENVPQSSLNAGTTPNTLTVEEMANPDVTVDSVFLNWFEVDYYKTFVAEGDRLKFTARGNGTQSFSISNFSNPAIQVFDVSDPLKVRRLANPAVTGSGGSYMVKFSDTVSGEATYLVIAGSPSLNDLPSMFYLTPSSLKSTNNGADYIIITHEDLKDSVLPLAGHREGKGYRVKVVTTREIYDEFSAGIFTPVAIKNFLKYAYEKWKRPAPEFVVLVGDANVDYKDNWKTGQINHVPTYLIETSIVGETPSDHWFVTVAGDDPLPDMLIGRIPAKTAGEVSAVVNKIIAYETGGHGDWQNRLLFASNDADPRFEEYLDEWSTHLPSNYNPDRIYASQYTDKTQTKVDLLKGLNDGVLMTSFFGHGNVDLWASSPGTMLFTSEDAPLLTNGGKYPFVAAFNCLNGLFAEPSEGKWISLPDGSSLLYAIPLPEALLFQEGRGALAFWSPSAFAYPSEQRWIGHELFSGLFEQGNNILGSATTLAKVNAYVKKGIYVENLDVFTFFGDPATRLALDIRKPEPSSGSGGGGCFIATAAYGSYLHPYVKILRDFRDRVLLQREWGREIVDLYYRLSPPAAKWISEREWARGVVRVFLLPVIFLAWLFVGASGWVKGGVIVFALLFLLFPMAIVLRRRFGASTTFFCVFFCLASMCAITDPWNSAWASENENDLRLIRSDEQGLSVDLILPPYRIVRRAFGQEDYDSVEVGDYGFIRETGRPSLPMRGMLIGIPDKGNVSLKVTPGEYERRWLRIGPAPLPGRSGGDSTPPVRDNEIYGRDAFYPGPLAAEGFTGHMRDQRVMQILFYPVQYNPVTGEVRIYKRIKITVDFEEPNQLLKKAIPVDGDRSRSKSRPGGAYEKLLKGSLLNYP